MTETRGLVGVLHTTAVRASLSFALAAVFACGGRDDGGGGGDPGSDGEPVDPDAPAIVLGTMAMDLAEGGAPGATRLALSKAPEGLLTIQGSAGDGNRVSLNMAQLSFTAADFAKPRDVLLSALQDADPRDETVVVSFSAPGLRTAKVNVRITDDEEQRIIAAPQMVALTEGRSSELMVSLALDPGAPATVAIDSPEPSVTVEPRELRFTTADHSAAQRVTIRATADADVSDERFRLTLKTSDGPDGHVDVEVEDLDMLRVSVMPETLQLTEGRPHQFVHVTLSHAPDRDLVVDISSSDIDAARVFPPSVRFNASNYMLGEDVAIVPVDDGDVFDESVMVRFRGSGLSDLFIPVAIDDDD